MFRAVPSELRHYCSRSFLVTGALSLFVSSQAAAEETTTDDTKLVCAKSYEKAQRLRKGGALVEARAEAIVCAQSECPSVLSSDCGKWVEEIDASLPTHIFELLGPKGEPLVDVELSLDGGAFETNSGRAIPLDPGSHEVVFRLKDGELVKRDFVATEGQRGVLVQASVPRSEQVPGGALSESAGSVPTVSWVLGGVGLVGAAGFAAFALLGKSEENGLDCTEEEPCDREVGDSAKSLYLAADVSLALGVAAALSGTAVWFFSTDTESARVGLQLQRSGGTLAWSGSF